MGRRVRSRSEFAAFVGRAEPALRRALGAALGPGEGQQATVDALTWAWEHWSELSAMENPIGYLYRVGQTAARRSERPLRWDEFDDSTESNAAAGGGGVVHHPELVFEPKLRPALEELSDQQRVAVVLVHGYGYSLREAADVLEISVSTLREHVGRGMTRLRNRLEAHHVD